MTRSADTIVAHPKNGVDATFADWIVSFGDPAKMAEPWSRGFPRLAVLGEAQNKKGLHVYVNQGRVPPAIANDAHISVIFEGILYNRQDLINALKHSNSNLSNDAEIMLETYRRWGERALEKIKGIFAFVIRDASRDVLLCARDHFGIYPLFFSNTGRELLISTSIEALVRHPNVSRTVNRLTLANYLMNRIPEIEETFHQDINRVPPGHILQVTNGVHRIERYWSIAVPGAGAEPANMDELEQFDELMEQAVNRCVELGPSGIFLSGGLDSVSIAAYATETCRRSGAAKPLALSLAFPEPCSEAAVQLGVAEALDLPQLVLPLENAVGPSGQVIAALRMSSQLSAPMLHFWLPAYVRLGQEARRRDCRVIMTGAGGDDWLGVGPSYCADLLQKGSVGGLYELFRAYRRSFGTTPGGFLRLLWGFGARPLLESAGAHLCRRMAPQLLELRRERRLNQRLRKLPDWLAPDPTLRQEISEHFSRRAVKAQQDTRPAPAGLYWKRTREYLDQPFLVMIKEENFESFRRIGLQEHLPFWDVDLISLLGRTPPELLNQGGLSKGLVRQKLAEKFPRLGFERQKKLWASNYFDLVMKSEMQRACEHTKGISALAALGVVDSKRINSRTGSILAGHQAQSELYGLWLLLNAESWTRPRI
jgi:asparagine synthase (glutamine-hydrolysing)